MAVSVELMVVWMKTERELLAVELAESMEAEDAGPMGCSERGRSGRKVAEARPPEWRGTELRGRR